MQNGPKSTGKGKSKQTATHAVPSGKKGKKWSLSVDKFSAGPVALSNLKLNSRSKARARNFGASDSQKAFIFPHTELLGSIDGSAGFTCQQIRLQPGDESVMPWLATIAGRYERYKIRKFDIIYKPNVTAYVDGGQRGQVILAFDYDASSPPMQDITSAKGNSPNVSDLPTKDMCLTLSPVLCTPEAVGKFVRTVQPLPGQSANNFDFGVLNICTQGTTSGESLGYLYFSYEVEFFNAELRRTGEASKAFVAKFDSGVSDEIVTGGTVTAVAIFREVIMDNITIEKSGNATIFLRPGTYRVSGKVTVLAQFGAGYSSPQSLARVNFSLNFDKVTWVEQAALAVREVIIADAVSARTEWFEMFFDEILVITNEGQWGANEDATALRVEFVNASTYNVTVLEASINKTTWCNVELLSVTED